MMNFMGSGMTLKKGVGSLKDEVQKLKTKKSMFSNLNLSKPLSFMRLKMIMES